MKNRYHFLFLGFCLFLFDSCGTKHNNIFSRSIHNLTSHYNGYFNARELVREGETTLADKMEDKYDRLLPIFKHGDKKLGKSVETIMDRAIEKSSRVIQRHSMIFKGREFNRWIDDNYLIIGKAKYYKRDLYPAMEALQFIPGNYPKQSSRFEALAFLILAYCETGNQIEAEGVVDYLKNEKKIPLKLMSLCYAACAHYYIAVKNYPHAIEMLTKAVTRTKEKIPRIRYMFILAQLHQLEGDNLKAYQMYNQVIRKNPPYEMAFNAKINRARVLDIDSKNSEYIEEELAKMLKDAKNTDYFDQIYYAQAGIEIRRTQFDKAKDLLQKSIKASTKNTNQKALSYLELGKLYFEDPDYRKAQVCYDSASTFLSSDHPDYEKVKLKKQILNKLIDNLNIVAYEDSMQALAKLSPKDLEKEIDKMIKKAEALEAQKKKDEAEKLKNAGTAATTAQTSGPPGGGGSKWYFYNPTAISYGITEFTKRFGTRKLEDHWRRIDKQSEDMNALAGEADSDSAAGPDSLGIYNRAMYVKDVPGSPEKLDASNNKIIEALYDNAGIYREQLYDRKAAAKTLEELLKRYPENKFQVQTYYQLFRMYKDIGQDEKSNYYKNLILTKFPGSEYAKVVANPNYLKEMVTEKQKLERFYQQTYDAYLSLQFETVIRNKDVADSMYPQNELAPKFALLKALSIGKTRDLDQFEASLKTIISDHPKDPVREKAQELIGVINKVKGNPAFKGDTAGGVAPTPKPMIQYSMNVDTATVYVVTFVSGELNEPRLMDKLRDYNQKNNLGSLQVSSRQYDSRNLLVAVRGLPGKAAAEQYYKAVSENASLFLTGDVYVDFLISDGNLEKFLEDKRVSLYKGFFTANYEVK